RNASVRARREEGWVIHRYPTRGIFFGCCASTEPQSAKSMAQRVRTVTFLVMFSPAPSTRTLVTLTFFSFDYRVRPRQHVRRYRQADLLGSFQIDDELEFLRLLHGKVRRFGTFQNLVNVSSSAPVQVGNTRAVKHQATDVDMVALRVYRWETAFGRHLCNLC